MKDSTEVLLDELLKDYQTPEQMHFDKHLDGIGSARYAELDQLNKYAKITWSKKIDANPASCKFSTGKNRMKLMYFLVKLDWIPKHNGGRDTIPPSTYFCTTQVKFENSLTTCSIRLEIKQDDTNTAYLHFLFEKFSSVVALNDSLTLFEGPHQIGYATILSIIS